MSDKKSVAIITLPGSFNYGNRLQNYAVTRIYDIVSILFKLLSVLTWFGSWSVLLEKCLEEHIAVLKAI